MNRLDDEILNKYIDGELSLTEVQSVMKILNESESDRERYLVLSKIHQGLKSVREEQISSSFTLNLMEKIKAKYGVRKKDKYFLFSISSVMVGMIILLLGYIFSIAFSSTAQSQGQNQLLNNSVNFIQTFSIDLIKIFSKADFSIIGTVISIVMLGIAYVFYENLRSMKQRLHKPGN